MSTKKKDKRAYQNYVPIALAVTSFQVSQMGLLKRVSSGSIRFLKEPSRGKQGFRYLVHFEDLSALFARRASSVVQAEEE